MAMLCALRQHLTLCKTKPKQQNLAALVDVLYFSTQNQTELGT